LSATLPQFWHVSPPTPQAGAVVGFWHEGAQQPPGQVPGPQPLHTPLLQVSAPGQAAQATPLPPQTPGSVPGWHCSLTSQQPAQVVESQRQVPETQC
jgi:hypothetical protein